MSRQEWLMSSSRMFVGLTLLSYLALTLGCGSPEPSAKPAATVDGDHDGHGHGDEIDVDGLMPLSATPAPESLEQGIEQLAAVRDLIAQGFAEDDVDSIHDELHSVGDLLEHLEQMIADSEMSDDVKQQAQEAIAKLFDAFGDVDAKLHGDDGKDYADVSDEIDSSVETLNNLELS